LVVEQKVNPDKNNFGIRPLPNLETKFVAANTLIGIEKPKIGDQLNMYSTDGLKKLETELKKVRSKLFSAKSKDTKIKYRQRDEELRNQIAEELEKSGWKGDTAQKLAGWDPYNQNASSPFFDPEWMFDIKEGFDVVIGNPPYGNIFKEKTMFNKILSFYSTAEYKIDAYAVFIEKGTLLLNKNGSLNFITPYTFLSGTYFSQLRKFIYSHHLRKLTVLGKKVFEAAEVDTCILILQNENKSRNCTLLDLRKYDAIEFLKKLMSIEIPLDLLLKSYEEVICVGNEKEIEIFQSLNESTLKLDNYFDFYHGIQTRGNSTSITDEKIEGSYPLIMGRDFNKFTLHDIKQYFILKPENIKSGGDLSFHHTTPKIIIRTTADGIIATIEKDKNLVLNSVNIAVPKAKQDYSLESVLGIINSRLVDFWYRFAVQEPGKTFAEVKIVYLKRIPFPTFNELSDFVIQYLVINLLHINNNKDSLYNYFTTIVDAIVFNLYFPEHMEERGIDVLKFVEKDINDVMEDRLFEKLDDNEKEKVIEELHSKWSHPDNEVHNRIKLFALRSPEILKPILES
jgi:tRNA1(Val) A37 N6-methylase TrmN6